MKDTDSNYFFNATKKSILTTFPATKSWISLRDQEDPKLFKFQRVQIEEFSQTFDYGLKDLKKSDDFNQVFNWGNSSLHEASNYWSISMN